MDAVVRATTGRTVPNGRQAKWDFTLATLLPHVDSGGQLVLEVRGLRDARPRLQGRSQGHLRQCRLQVDQVTSGRRCGFVLFVCRCVIPT